MSTVRFPLTLLLLSVALTACQSAGAIACPDFMDMSKQERTSAFLDVVDDRGLSFGGPDWQTDLRVAAAESYCMNNSSSTLDAAVDFAGVPRR